MSQFNTTTIALNQLITWSGNVRKTNTDEGIGELAASIAAHGLLQSLVVRQATGGNYAVIAGQRRYRAMLRLLEQGKIDAAYPVDCRVVTEGANATEISLAENVVRQPMHPADQFEAWRDLADGGMDVAEIAARFGVAGAVVVKRLKLGRVSPDLLALYKAGDMSLEQVQAFTVSDDQAEQLRVWNSLQGWQRQPEGIRRALTKEEIPATDKRVRFVGLEAYEAAGGTVRRDLFDAENAGWVCDNDLLDRLTSEKLKEEAATVQAEGWKWVEIRSEFGRADQRQFHIEQGEQEPLTEAEDAEVQALYAEFNALNENDAQTEDEDARIEAIETRLDVLTDRPFLHTPETKAIAGAIIVLHHDGEIDIMRGLVRREDVSDGSDGAARVKEKSPFSAALTRSLTQEVTGAMQAEYAANPKLALVAVVHGYLLARHDHAASYDMALRISGSASDPVEGSAAELTLAKLEKKVLKGKPADATDLWAWLAKQKQERLLDMLAVLTAPYVDGGSAQAGVLREALEVDLRKWFTPTAENYFGRISTAQIQKDLRETGNGMTLTGKKAELAAIAEQRMSTDSAAHWLPEPMRIRTAAQDRVEDQAEPIAA